MDPEEFNFREFSNTYTKMNTHKRDPIPLSTDTPCPFTEESSSAPSKPLNAWNQPADTFETTDTTTKPFGRSYPITVVSKKLISNFFNHCFAPVTSDNHHLP